MWVVLISCRHYLIRDYGTIQIWEVSSRMLGTLDVRYKYLNLTKELSISQVCHQFCHVTFQRRCFLRRTVINSFAQCFSQYISLHLRFSSNRAVQIYRFLDPLVLPTSILMYLNIPVNTGPSLIKKVIILWRLTDDGVSKTPSFLPVSWSGYL